LGSAGVGQRLCDKSDVEAYHLEVAWMFEVTWRVKIGVTKMLDLWDIETLGALAKRMWISWLSAVVDGTASVRLDRFRGMSVDHTGWREQLCNLAGWVPPLKSLNSTWSVRSPVLVKQDSQNPTQRNIPQRKYCIVFWPPTNGSRSREQALLSAEDCTTGCALYAYTDVRSDT
jgi:hypothetical protein